MSLAEENPAGTQAQWDQLPSSSSGHCLQATSPHQPGHVLPSPGLSLQKESESHRAVPPIRDMCPASHSTRGGFRLRVEARGCPGEGPRGLSSLQQRWVPEPSWDEVLSPPCLSIHLDRTWTISTTARTAGSLTCWTSATWRAGESLGRAACCASCHASACPPPPRPWQDWLSTLPRSPLEAFYRFTRSKDATSAG